MDIVDTFNHLIPTEHLDDALFLGSNLESEGCEEFATGQHVIEDSLKNMLSDKDPMLGSASTQFCLPVLDNAEHNFQIPPSAGVGLDDIMDVGVDKVTAADINDEDDLILPDKNLNRLNEPSIKPVRKSPRLKAQESTRVLRPSTIDKTLNAVKVASPKKSKSPRKDTPVDKATDKEHTLPIVSDDNRSNSTQNSRRSTRIANKECKDNVATDQKCSNKETSDEESSTINDILSNTQRILEKEDGHTETLVLLSANSNKGLEEETEHDLNNSQGDNLTGGVLETPVNEKAYKNENYATDDKKTDVIYDKVHQELALLSGVVECDLGVKTGLHPEVNVECMLKNAVDRSIQECEPSKNSVSSEVLNTSDKCDSLGDTTVVESLAQNCTEDLESGEKEQTSGKEISADNGFGKPNRNRKGIKRLKPSSAKVPMSIDDSAKNTASSKDGSLHPPHQKGRFKKSIVAHSDTIVLPDKSKIIKVTKKGPVSNKTHPIPIKTAIKKKPQRLAERKGNSSTLLKQLDDVLRDSQGTSKETAQVMSSLVRSRSLSHSSDKSANKQSLSKAAPHLKDIGEQKEAAEHSEEKTKLKKSLPPRQRRSSKSVSVDEPPLFIPDNIPTVKKEGTDVTSPTADKYVWNPTRHCSSCRKLHGNRFMVGCGRCDDWFHGECVGLSLAQAQQMEVDDKEYICVKCCVEEEKMDTSETISSSNSQKPDLLQEHKTLESNKPVTTGGPGLPHEKTKQADDTMKHKVKISKKSSGDNKQVSERKDMEMKKHTSDKKTLQSAPASHRVSEEKRERPSKDSTAAPSNDEKTPKSGTTEKQDIKRKKPERKGSSSGVPNSSPSTPKPSVDQIRQSVRQSLKDILLKRLSESSSKIPEERASKVSVKIEKELFSFYRDTDSKYKNKYRSLMFNLKDPKNNVLYKRVLRGDITPEHLIKMTPEELASKELAAWRQRENRHTIEMIEKEQREVERRPITKITHKGEIEIESDAPIKEPEAMDTEESIVKTIEKEEETQKDKEPPTESTSDTTAQHKNHLFDLNCKICTGRMAPPAEDMSPKKVKVSMSSKREESETVSETSIPATIKIDPIETEKPESPKETFFSAPSSEPFNITEAAEDESTFLSRLTYIWKGFLNMPSVAKFIIKAYPVSGSLDHLSEDLPESIQVGGRISPQTVWDYVEKIRASGTKETCVIRFCPETEEDQISYTLLYSYFSSRKRYGVVANNMRQVKDMYLIPLGASEKIPHFFVPFDGPGLEARRPNLLLALIIRQKVKRQHSTSLDDDQLGALLSVPEKKNRNDAAAVDDDDDDEEDDENDFFNSFSAVLHKSRNRPQLSDNDEPQTSVESAPEAVKKEPPKPLRFLPGVLVGWENPQSAIDLANKPLPVDDILQSLLGTTENTFGHKSPVTTTGDQTLKEGKKLKEETVATETIYDNEMNTEMDITAGTEETKENPTPIVLSQSGKLSVSLKDKPPDVPTEVYLAKINTWSSDETVEKVNSTGPTDFNQDIEEPNLSPAPESKSSIDGDNTLSVDTSENSLKPSKLMHIKRDPRQAATRSHINSPDSKDYDVSKNEEDTIEDKELNETTLKHKKAKNRKQSHEESDLLTSRSDKSKSSLSCSSVKNKAEIVESSRTENTKQYPPDLLIDETDPLQQFRRALAANKTQSQASNSLQAETSSKTSSANFTGNFSPLRLQSPSFLPLKSNPPPFPFQHTPSFPLQGNPIFSYPPHIPPLLPTPLSINFARPPRFQSTEPSIHNPLVAWHPALQIPRQPPFFAPVTSGPLLNSEQVGYPSPQKLYHKDHRVQERRHSDPWDKQDRDRSFSRGSRSEHRQRFYSESHHSKEKRHEKESGSEKHGDKDSERSRRRDREKEKSHDRDRKSRDESHREKEKLRASHSDKSSDSRTSKERRSSDKSKSEDRGHDKDKTRDRNRDRDDEKDKDRHHKDRSRDHNDKSKSKR